MIVVVLLSRERHFVVGNLENGRRQTSPLSLSLDRLHSAHTNLVHSYPAVEPAFRLGAVWFSPRRLRREALFESLQ